MAPAHPDGGLVGMPTSTGTGATGPADASPGPDDAGAGADAGPAFYSPTGCAYTFNPPPSRPFTGYALDDTTQPAAGAGVPVRVRVGLGGGTTKGAAGYADPTTTAAFLWETPQATTNARVKYGTSPTALSSVQTGFVYTSPPPTVGVGSNEPATYFHRVDVCGLTPGATYYYQVGGGAAGSEVWSATQSFSTVPASDPITVGVYGDARDLDSTWTMVNQRMVGSGATLLLISGDMVDLGAEESLFQQWLSDIWTTDAGAPNFITLGQYMLVPIAGNHENESSQFYANFAIPGTGQYAETFASFDVGNTHFVMIDDEEIGTAPTSAAAKAQLAWIDSDLAAANADRTKHPFIVTVSHRGMFSTSEHASDLDVLQVRSSLAPLFDKYHVTLVLNGHDHEYERSLPVNDSNGTVSIVDGGTTYVINAGAGAEPYPVASYTPTPDYRAGTPTPLGSLSTKGYIGCYALLTLQGTTLELTAYGMKASGGSVAGDDVIDTVTFGQ